MLALVEGIAGPVRVETMPTPAGDPRCTAAELGLTTEVLGWMPTTPLADGLAAQAEWHDAVSAYDAVIELG